MCATTISGGTTWTPELAGYFKDRDVVILPDFNSAGATKAMAAANALHGVAKTIRVVVLPGLNGGPNSKDVTDWLDADRSREKKFSRTTVWRSHCGSRVPRLMGSMPPLRSGRSRRRPPPSPRRARQRHGATASRSPSWLTSSLDEEPPWLIDD